ncbi:MAG: N-6 DNA methylase [Firmicutes bacterium]|nr:N-6 DNA methylase [Bacillota bacterium]MCL1953655.1 N-6 DNA methylase [Bacillota bacterium]
MKNIIIGQIAMNARLLNTNKSNLVKSKERVSQHGEVFTPSNIVQDMLDNIKNECNRIDSRFLEPACGTGNFLCEVLKRKLAVVQKRYKNNQNDFEHNAIIAVCSCYGVDILQDNVEECRKNLHKIFLLQYKKIYKSKIRYEVIKSVDFILSKNIICGDALTMTTHDGTPIVFSQWSSVDKFYIKRDDFELSNLLQTYQYHNDIHSNQQDMFDLSKSQGLDLILPRVIKDFNKKSFDKLSTME